MNRKTASVAAVVALAAAACAPSAVPGAQALSDNTVCSLDGMLLADFPGPKGQIVYDAGAPDVFCDTLELISSLLRPEEQRRVLAAYTQDMAATSWEHPSGHWIDARSAFYVTGSRKEGSMGPTLAAFSREGDAKAFAAQNGGRVLAFKDLTADMVALDGGVLKDGATR